MRFDPAADPWGAAMLGAAALWLLSLLVMLAAVLGRTSRRNGGILMLVSLLAFLGAALGGTWDRIRRGGTGAEASEDPAEGEIAATVREDLGGSTGGSGVNEGGAGERGTADGSTGGTADGNETRGESSGGTAGSGAASSGEGTGGEATQGDGASGDATTGEREGTTGEVEPSGGTSGEAESTGGEESAGDASGGDLGATEPEPAVTGEPVVPEELPKVEPLPTEERARAVAIREILDEAERAAGGGERCGNLQRVAKAWAQLELIPVTRKAKAVTKDLERCRRRLLYSVSQKRLAEMVEDRDRWFAKLPTKLRKQEGLVIQASVSGSAHERLRIGNRELDAARADALMDGGLRDELVRLQFAQVVISNGKKAKTYALPVTREGELGLPWLRAVGLGEPLRLAE
jgi:hypothetical protein